ncbi:hypothetical protein C8Q76DRAFT_142539 [Earliella scabrosa]|nr:hypothetical protein C8Q76DRAFT_142539 [Earliella scabrosa]
MACMQDGISAPCSLSRGDHVDVRRWTPGNVEVGFASAPTRPDVVDRRTIPRLRRQAGFSGRPEFGDSPSAARRNECWKPSDRPLKLEACSPRSGGGNHDGKSYYS